MFKAPVVLTPEMVSFNATQLNVPTDGSNCWKVKVRLLAVVGGTVTVCTIGVAGTPPSQKHWAVSVTGRKSVEMNKIKRTVLV